jgi:hypothetical protein
LSKLLWFKRALLVLGFSFTLMMMISLVTSYIGMFGATSNQVLIIASASAFVAVPFLSASLLCVILYLALTSLQQRDEEKK